MKTMRTGRAFSLMELIVVAAVICILLALLFPAIGRIRERSRTATCIVNLKQIGTALHLYISNNNDYTPPRGIDAANTPGAPQGFGPPNYPPYDRATWSDQIILGQYAGSTNGDNTNPEFRNTSVKRRSSFVCPSDTIHDQGTTMHCSYGMGTNFPYVNPIDKSSLFWKTTRISNQSTEMVAVDCAEYAFAPGGWTEPYKFFGTPDDASNRNFSFSGDPLSVYNWAKRHNGGGANVLFLDGSARFIPDLKSAYDQKEIQIHVLIEH